MNSSENPNQTENRDAVNAKLDAIAADEHDPASLTAKLAEIREQWDREVINLELRCAGLAAALAAARDEITFYKGETSRAGKRIDDLEADLEKALARQ